MHYYQFNIGDYASHTRHLTIIEDIAYRKLLDQYYLQERPLDACSTSVARLIGMREYQEEVETILNEFFRLTDEGWVNTRADREIAHYKDKQDKASKAGKASAKQRTMNGRSTDVQPNNNHKPINNNQEPIIKKQLATRLPTDWHPTDEHLSFCRQNRPDLDPYKVADGFKDYWISVAGAKGRKQDWMATWRNWVRNQRQETKQTSYHDERKQTLDALTGRGKKNEGLFDERDITAEAQRIA